MARPPRSCRSSLREALEQAAEQAGELEAFGKISKQFKKLSPGLARDRLVAVASDEAKIEAHLTVLRVAVQTLALGRRGPQELEGS